VIFARVPFPPQFLALHHWLVVMYKSTKTFTHNTVSVDYVRRGN